MAAYLTDFLDAIADQIETALAGSTWPIQVWPRYLSSPTPPAVDMFPGDIARGIQAAAFGGDGEYLITVRARVTDNDEDGNQDLLMGLMDGPDSIVGALRADVTLGGIADDLYIAPDQITGVGTYPFASRDLVGFQFTCLVIRADS